MGNGLLLQYVVIGLDLAVAFLVLIDNPRNAFNRSFSAFVFGAVIWIFCADMVSVGKNFTFFRPALWGSEIMILGFVLLAKFFPDGKEDGGKITKKYLVFLLPWLIIFFSTSSQLVIRFADINNDGYLDAIGGILFPVRFAVMAWYLLWGLLSFFGKYRTLAPSAKTQNFSFVMSASLFAGAVLVCDVLFPMFHIFNLVLVGILFSLVFIGCMAYAVIRYRLMDIRLIVKRGVVYVAAIFIVALFYFGASFFLQEFLHENDALTYPASGVAAAVLCMFGFLYLKREFEEMTDRFFFRGEYDYFTAVQDLSNAFYSTVDLDDFLGSVGEIFSRTIKPERIIFFLDGEQQQYFFDGISRKPLAGAEHDDYKALVKNFHALPPQSFFVKEAERTMDDIHLRRRKKYELVCAAAQKGHIAAIVPIFSKEKTNAILLLGDKRAGTAFSSKDKELLLIASHQTGMAIENATLCAALRRHTAEFEHRVYERTKRIKNMYDGQAQFLADISHEFQTPLSIMKGNIECLEKKGHIKGSNELYTIATTLDRLSRLVHDVLGIARLNSSKAILAKKRIGVEKLIEETYDDCTVLSKEKGVTLSFLSEKCFVFGSADKLKEVLLNLISNALKHTSPGGAISLSAKTVDEEVEIAVTDTGSGISHKNLPHVFERLYKIDSMGLAGTGLGLFICRQIIEAHNGTIIAESRLGEGSRFVIHLPVSTLHDPEKFGIV